MSLSLTHTVLLSGEPDSRETVTTSFPVTPFLSTLTSQVRKYIETYVSDNGSHAHLHLNFPYSEYVCTCIPVAFVGMFCVVRCLSVFLCHSSTMTSPIILKDNYLSVYQHH